MDQFSEHNLTEGLDSAALRDYRKSLRESQFSFWSRFGVSQSRGSRFEMGTPLPAPVAILLKLYFGGVITDKDLDAQGTTGRGAQTAKRRQATPGKSAPAQWL